MKLENRADYRQWLKESRAHSKTIRRYILTTVLWNLACEHDGIARGAEFVSFSLDNPWAHKLGLFNEGIGDVLGFTVGNH